MNYEGVIPAMVLLFIATVLNIISFALPEWSKGHEIDASLADELADSKVTIGLWGFCADIELRKNGSSINEYPTFSRCFYFHAPSSFNLTDITDQFSSMPEFSGQSVCEAYDNAESAGDLMVSTFIKMLAFVAGSNEVKFAKFLERSCGGVGNASLDSGGLSVGADVFAYVLLTLVALRRKLSPTLIAMALFSLIVASFAEILVFVLWHCQTNMLNDTIDLRRSSSSDMSIAATFFNVVTVFLLMPDDTFGTFGCCNRTFNTFDT